MKRKYVFRWKDVPVEVKPSRGDSPQDVWEFARKNLYPAYMYPATPENAKEIEHFLRENGEVVLEGATN